MTQNRKQILKMIHDHLREQNIPVTVENVNKVIADAMKTDPRCRVLPDGTFEYDLTDH